MCIHSTNRTKIPLEFDVHYFAYGKFEKFKFCLPLGFHQNLQWCKEYNVNQEGNAKIYFKFGVVFSGVQLELINQI